MVDLDLVDVLIVGAGPTGLSAACEARRLGLSVRIIDRSDGKARTDSRALVVHPRVMELLDIYPSGEGNESSSRGAVTTEMRDVGCQLKGLRLHLNPKKEPVEMRFSDAKMGDTEFKGPTSIPKHCTERALESQFAESGGIIEWNKSLQTVQQRQRFDGSGHEYVRSTIVWSHEEEISDGDTVRDICETVDSRYVVGCDGERSSTRDLLGIEFNKEMSRFLFVNADVHLKLQKDLDSQTVNFFSTPEGIIIMFPLVEENYYRMFLQVPITMTDSSIIDEEFLNSYLRSKANLNVSVDRIESSSLCGVTHGMSDACRKGRVFLAGDARQVPNPVGGQGMNYGIQDSFNLMWKLAWCLRLENYDSCKDEAVLETIMASYESERNYMGGKLVDRVELGTEVLLRTTRTGLARHIRDFCLKTFVPSIMKQGGARNISQLNSPYPRDTAIICKTVPGTFICKPGDRLPNLTLADGRRLYGCLSRTRHSWVLLNGADRVEASGLLCGLEKIVVGLSKRQESPPKISTKSLQTMQAILVRPDLHVAGIASTIDEIGLLMQEKFVLCAIKNM